MTYTGDYCFLHQEMCILGDRREGHRDERKVKEEIVYYHPGA